MSWKTPLKRSLYRLCERQIAADPSFAPKRTCVDDETFAAYRQHKLTRTLRYAARNSAFYAERLDGLDLDAIKVDDLSAIPLTSPEDIAARAPAILCESQTKAARIYAFASSGTTGPSKRLYFAAADIDESTDFMACGIATVVSSGGVVQILLPGGCSNSQSDLLRKGVEKMGATPVVTGMELPFEEQVRAIRENGSQVLFGESHLIYRLTKHMEGRVDLRSLGVRMLFLTTSYPSPVMRNYLRKAWDAEVSIHYGMTEMGLGFAVTCPVCGGCHYNELGAIAEVVEPVTGRVLPSGEEGEIVVTSIGKRCMPLLRYRTGDLGRIERSAEGCPSASFESIGDVRCRRETLVRLRSGLLVSPTFFHDAVFSQREVIDYELTLRDAERGVVVDSVLLHVEATETGADLAACIAGAVRAAAGDEGLHVEVRFVDYETLRQGRHFKKLIADERCLRQPCPPL